MAIDLNNRNPSDPNGVASISSSQTPAWISDDWNTLTLDSGEGATKKLREVRIVRVTTNDGREFRAVLDGQGQPISVIGDQTGINTDQQHAFTQQQSTTKAPNGQQYSRGPDGTINEWNPNSNPPGYNIPHPEMAPAGTVYTPEQRQAQASTAQTAQAENNERQWNSDHGYGWITHAQRAEQVQKQQADARAENNQQRITAAQEAANQLARDRLQFDKDKANLPETKVEDRPVNGAHHTQVTRVTPQGQATIKYYGPDGKEEAALPTTGAASVGGPPLPQFVAGHTEEALRTYHASLWADTSQTPEQREKHFQEAVQIANLVVQEAATIQNDRESQRQTDYNVGVQKLGQMKSATDSAWDLVAKLNGTLPKGSSLGGEAFAALFGLQMLQLEASGLNDVTSAGKPKVPTVTARDLSSPSALASINQTIADQAAQRVTEANQRAAASQAAAPVSTAATTPTATTASAPQTGATAASTASAAPAPTTSTAMPRAITAEEAAAYERGGINPATGDISVQETPAQSTNAAPYQGDQRQPAPQPDYGQPSQEQQTTEVPVDTRDPSVNPDTIDPQSQMQSLPPILAQYQTPMTPPVQPTQEQQQQPTPIMNPAMLMSHARTTPPWRLTEEDIAQMRAAGVSEDDIRSIPGYAAA